MIYYDQNLDWFTLTTVSVPYVSLSHLDAHAAHLYRTFGAASNYPTLDSCYIIEANKLGYNMSYVPTPLVYNRAPHEMHCRSFIASVGSQTCNCSYAQLNLAFSPSTPSSSVESFDDLFSIDKPFDPSHTCEESLGPLFREGTGKPYTYCIRCGNWLREWKS